jgi:hypothetical protein
MIIERSTMMFILKTEVLVSSIITDPMGLRVVHEKD